HLRGGLKCVRQSTSRLPKARAASPAPSQNCLRQRVEANLGRDSQIAPVVALPVSPPDPSAAGPPRQQLYTAGAGTPPLALPPLRPPTGPPHRAPPMSFSRHQGIYYVVLGKPPDTKS